MCRSGYFLWQGACGSSCVAGTYAEGGRCSPCAVPCATCSYLDVCLSCLAPYYLNGTDSSVCVLKCPDRTYPDLATRVCVDCNPECASCTDPRWCLACDEGQRLTKSASGECTLLSCLDGTYIAVNSTTRTATCASCDQTCKACVGPGRNNCITCAKGRFPFPVGKAVKCKTCEEVDPGFITSISQTCQGSACI